MLNCQAINKFKSSGDVLCKKIRQSVFIAPVKVDISTSIFQVTGDGAKTNFVLFI